MLSPPVSAPDFTGSWSLLVNGYKGEIYLKQEGSRVSGWLGVGGVNLDGDVIAGTVLGSEGWEALHVGEAGLDRADDFDILEFARQRGMACVTLDHDFHTHLALALSASPSLDP